MEIIITTIGRVSQDKADDSVFLYNGKFYEKLLNWNHLNLLLDSEQNTGFFLKEEQINGIEHVILCYRNLNRSKNYQERQTKKFLIESFFEVSSYSEIETRPQNSRQNEISLERFYDLLKKAHENDDLETGVPENVQHRNLRPILRPYQIKGVKWMLSRELRKDYLPNYIKLSHKFNNNMIFYYNPYSQQILSSIPEIPHGGLLTDEMGLGKTVEIIALILMNPRRAGSKRKMSEVEDSTLEINEQKTEKIIRKSKVKCICHKIDCKRNTITCNECGTLQHTKCVFLNDVTAGDRENYKCPFCWKTTNNIIDSSTTLIVMPASIKTQWKNEIQRHVNDKSFKLLMYNGVSKGWISPTDLVRYDVVITDFNILSSELYFSDPVIQERELRHPKKFEYPPSPLTAVRFWRVVLDEAQMVENKNNRPSQMVKQLPAVHRWATTGTPIEKDSILCLYGLIFFLNLTPYTDEIIFNELFSEYRSGKPEKMIQLLSKVMWRTCKKDVEDQINIPSTTEIIHQITMTDLQECFYRQAHVNTKPQFMKNLQDYLLRNGPIQYFTQQDGVIVRKRGIDLRMKDKFLNELNNATLKILLEPLRCLRQDCTIPSLVNQANDQGKSKVTLKPEQLHEHLVSKASLETKSALRTVCSSINGIAALKIAKENFHEAVAMYKQILKLASEYTGAVCVDSMLQIHAYQGLSDIASIVDNEEELKNKLQYETEMGKLEWKYIKNYYEKVEEINEKLQQHSPELQKASRELTDTDGNWWQDVIYAPKTREDEQRYMDTIHTEILSSSIDGLQMIEQLRTDRGLQMIITQWYDKIEKYTRDIKKRFNKLRFVVNGLRPKEEMGKEDSNKVENLTEEAQLCHLNSSDDNETVENSYQRRCDLCKLKNQLNNYECVLFNKSLVNDNVEGSRNPRFEEKLLKAIHDYAKRSDFDVETVEMGNNFFKYLEALKTQFKLHARLWVEVNYTISAFDELRMCKLRVQVVDSPELITENEAKYRLKIKDHEVQEQLLVFEAQRREAEMNFVRLNGRLKYLEHLKQRKDAPTCPICHCTPTERYFVTVCGHSFCSECYLVLVKKQNRSISCPVCRTTQLVENIYNVTCCNKENDKEPINGSFSPKIDEIVRTILRLKKNEPDVKILIFSHWDKILQAVMNALEANQITYRSSYKSNFSKQILEFKDFSQDVTCLVLNLKFGGKGLNLIEATHLFFVEPILNADEELQAIGRIHRIGQMRKTFIHKFIAKKTIEETIYNKIIREKEKWITKQFTIRDLEELYNVEDFFDAET